MDKNIKLNTSTIIFFVLNIIIFLCSIFLRRLYITLEYDLKVVNVVFVLNLILLLMSIVFNIYLLKYDNIHIKKIIILALIIIIGYGIINLSIISYMNKKNNAEYFEITEKLTSYCEEYYCNKYETFNLKKERKFSLEKLYTDYNNETQLIKISIIYDKVDIKEIKAIMYSSNESYSAFLIKEQLSIYLSNFNIKIDDEYINKAFELRDKDKIISKQQVYEVKSIYKNNNLDGFKTIIKISF